jgi:hypothetical protein
LGDPTLLTFDHVLLANGVEESGLAMVDMAHHGDDGGSGCQVLIRVVELGLFGDGRRGRCLLELHDVTEGLGDVVDLTRWHLLVGPGRDATLQ